MDGECILLYPRLMKLEKDAFHNGILDQSQSDNVKKTV